MARREMEPVDGEVEGGDREIEREVFGGKMILGKLVWVFWFSTHAGFRFFIFFFFLIKVLTWHHATSASMDA
jgi:hypothetical protein